ncbi:hypothetical protein Tco_1287960, partial [Tanacetum coccineum]
MMGKTDPYLGGAARCRVCSHGGSDSPLSGPVLAILSQTVTLVHGVVASILFVNVVLPSRVLWRGNQYLCMFLEIKSSKVICGGLIMQKIHGFSLFEGDDDNCLFTVCGLPTLASWQGDHTQVVVAAMAVVWH